MHTRGRGRGHHRPWGVTWGPPGMDPRTPAASGVARRFPVSASPCVRDGPCSDGDSHPPPVSGPHPSGRRSKSKNIPLATPNSFCKRVALPLGTEGCQGDLFRALFLQARRGRGRLPTWAPGTAESGPGRAEQVDGQEAASSGGSPLGRRPLLRQTPCGQRLGGWGSPRLQTTAALPSVPRSFSAGVFMCNMVDVCI